MGKAVKVSVAVITYNEANNIERCLTSVLSIADEIVILDSYSTDKTKEICSKFDCLFFEHPFDDYVAQRNRISKLCNNNIILALDADEWLSDASISEIEKIKQNWSVDAYWIKRLSSYKNRWLNHGLWYPEWKIRLFDKTHCYWHGFGVHESIHIPKDRPTKRINQDILHIPYHSEKELKIRTNSFSETWAIARVANASKQHFTAPFLHAAWTWIRGFFLKLAFLNGKPGIEVNNYMAREVFLKYKKLYLLQANIKNGANE